MFWKIVAPRRFWVAVAVMVAGVVAVFGMWSTSDRGVPRQLENTMFQGMIEGHRGEGSFLYRLKFDSPSTVKITTQQGSGDVYDEKHAYQFDGTNLIIASTGQDAIHGFDNAKVSVEGQYLRVVMGEYNGYLNRHHEPIAWIYFFITLIVLMALNEMFRHWGALSALFYGVLPFALIPLWMSWGVDYWFKWAKVYSVVFACLWFTLMRYTRLDRHAFAKIMCGGFLAVNIAEAVIQDFSMGHLPNVLNGIAGILSILTLWYGWREIGKDKSQYRDMVWMKMPVLWVIAYDVWNFVFVYLNFPGSVSGQTMVIISATLPIFFFKEGTWLQARAFTLAAWFMYYFTVPRFTEGMQVMFPRSTLLMLVAAGLSLALNAWFAVRFVQLVRSARIAKQVQESQ